MKFHVCCPDLECGAFQEALNFLKSYGVEPAIKEDEEGHYFDFEIPENPEFYVKLQDRISGPMPCCGTCFREDLDQVLEVTCEDCDNDFVVCEDCVEDYTCPFCVVFVEEDDKLESAIFDLTSELEVLKGLEVLDHQLATIQFKASDTTARFIAGLGESLYEVFEGEAIGEVMLLGDPETYLLKFSANDYNVRIEAIELMMEFIEENVNKAPELYKRKKK